MKKLFIFPALIIALLLCSCEKNNNSNSIMRDTLYELYPDAIDVDWDHERGGYSVAEFYSGSVEISLWFKNSEVVSTMIDIPSYKLLPTVIQDGLKNSKYADWIIEDIKHIKYPVQSDQYLISVESGIFDKELYFTAEGVLL